MNITMRPMSVEEVWHLILQRYKLYHSNLKKFGLSYKMFIPNNSSMCEMFDKETLTSQDIEKYRTVIYGLYNVKMLQRFDTMFITEVQPMIENAVQKVLTPLLPAWNAILPENLEILCTYGHGGGYMYSETGKATIDLHMSRMKTDKNTLFELLMHEFIHILIEHPIIRKYNVPKDLKERIVDIIGFEFFHKPVQPIYINSFANSYITLEAIKTDLPKAVAKMMADYIVFKQQNIPER